MKLKEKQKRLFAKISIVLFTLFTVLETFSYSYSRIPDDDTTISDSGDALGTPLDSIMESTSEYTKQGTEMFSDLILHLICNSFSPSFFTILDIEKGNQLDFGDVYDDESASYTKSEIMNTVFFKNIMGVCIIIGSCLATALLIGYLVICIAGRSNQIKDNPVALILKYIIVMVLIYLSTDIVYEMVNSIYKLWTGFITTSHYSALTTSTEGNPLKNLVYTDGSIFRIVGEELPVSKFKINFMWNCALPFIELFLIWKLVKQLIRLYLEIAERYFVMIILAAFFPAAVATFVGNGTKNIFFSYLRMFFSQGFIMVVNLTFMKFFLYVLFIGGWTCGILNYIAALAFMRVCQRLDTYLLCMGLNVAQTGGALLGSVGGALNAGMRMLSGFNKNRENIGKSLQVAGAASNNFSLFKAGAAVGASVKGFTASGGNYGNAAGFNDMVASLHKNNGMHVGDIAVNHGDPSTNGEWLNKTCRDVGIPQTQLRDMAEKGIDLNQIGQIECTGQNQYAFKDNKGNNIASSKDNEVFFNPTGKDERRHRDAIKSIINSGAEEADKLGEDPTKVTKSTLTARGITSADPTPGLIDYEALVGDGAKLQNVSYAGDSDNGLPYRSDDQIGVEKALLKRTNPDIDNAKNQDELIKVTTYDVTEHPEMTRYEGKSDYRSIKTDDGRNLMCHIERNYKVKPTADLSEEPSMPKKTTPKGERKPKNRRKGGDK